MDSSAFEYDGRSYLKAARERRALIFADDFEGAGL